MRHRTRRWLVLGFLMGMLAMMMVGCSYLGVRGPETPMERYKMASRGYSLAMETAMDLHEMGVLDLEAMQRVEEASILAERAFQAWELAMVRGGSVEEAKRKYGEAMVRINAIIAAGESEDGDIGSGRDSAGESGD